MIEAKVQRYKFAMLNCSTDDPVGWDLQLAKSDAIHAFPELSDGEIDELVRESLTELLDRGFIWFYRFSSWEDMGRPRTEEADALPRNEVVCVLANRAELLAFRATEAGRQYLATVVDVAD